ncbi:integrase, partial [Halorubrum sp. SP9]
MSSDLNPITPEQAKDLYNDEYEEKRSYESLRKARSVLDTFVEWTEQEGLENMNEIDGRQLQEMKMWWKRESDTNNVSLNGYLAVVRRFLVFCERIEVVSENTPDRMPQASIDEDEEVCDRKPDDEAVEAI